jgi:hypothetical protein
MQLFTINILVESSSLPFVYVLMANQAADTYERIFRVIDNRLGFGNAPISIMSDFEQGIQSAAKNVWPFAVFFTLHNRFIVKYKK